MSLIWMILLLPFCKASTPPNVLLVVADDLGYNDVSWHNPDIISPWMNMLVEQGVILESHYVQQMCTPSRAALMTGYYPIHTGRQHDVIRGQEPVGLFTNFTLMPQYFKEIGYRTHMVGKWHLGFCHENYLPMKRGFDTHYGFYTGAEDYFYHSSSPIVGGGPDGYDFRDQETVDYSVNSTYSSIAFAERLVNVIEDHVANHSDTPFFMYLPFQDVHGPLQVPKQYEEMYPEIKDDDRRVFSGMVSALDDALGLLLRTMHLVDLLENTIVVFLSDNGGQTSKGGNNYPLRGNKDTLWEGGTRSTSFVYSSLLKKKGIVNHELIHVVDWLPTLLSAVKDSLPKEDKEFVEKVLLEETDGIDQWSMLMNDEPSKRTEFLYNIDPIRDKENKTNPELSAAIRVGHMKLIVGEPGKPDGHIPPESLDIEKYDNPCNDAMREESCKSNKVYKIDGLEINLFNITEDPFEYNNIAEENPEIVEQLRAKLDKYQESMIPPNVKEQTEKGNPKYFDGVYSPGWCQSEPTMAD